MKVHNINRDRDLNKEFYIESYEELKSIMCNLYNDIEVQEIEEIEIDRVDIAIDRPISFEDGFKKHLYLFELVTYGAKKNTRWYTTNLDTLNRNSIKQSNNSFEVCFYNKEEESKGAFEYKTRLEFRFKRLNGNDLDKALDKLILKLQNIEFNITSITDEMIEKLCKMWEKKKAKKPTLSLTAFVSDNEEYFYNIDILKGVYKYVGLKGNLVQWLKKFRKGNKIEFVSDKKMKEMQKDMIKEVKRYKKS